MRFGRMIRFGFAAIFAFAAIEVHGQREPGMLGRASCAASTCHGGVIDRGPSWKFSLTRWANDDPHASAGLLLYNELSEKIIGVLDPAIADLKRRGDETWKVARDNLLRRRCISCHVSATPEQCDESQSPLASSFLAEGVSCESCHGPAADWIDQHTDHSFAGPERFTTATNMRDTETILGRTRVCVRCHIGSRSEDGLVRDMNHDIIAAGHPVLRFDLMMYDAALPQHWDRETTPRFYESLVRVRQASRALGLATAAKLASERAQHHLDERTEGPAGKSRTIPWPELSDYDCYSCHQSLSMDQYELPASDRGPKLQLAVGLPIWNAWHTIGVKYLTKENLEMLAPNSLSADAMATGGAVLASDFQSRAKELAGAEFEAPRNQLQLSIAAEPPRDWHAAAIVYLDSEAAFRDLVAMDPGNEGLAKLRRQLAEEVRSYLRFNAALHSPENFDIEASREFRDKLLKIIQAVPERSTSTQPKATNRP